MVVYRVCVCFYTYIVHVVYRMGVRGVFVWACAHAHIPTRVRERHELASREWRTRELSPQPRVRSTQGVRTHRKHDQQAAHRSHTNRTLHEKSQPGKLATPKPPCLRLSFTLACCCFECVFTPFPSMYFINARR